MIGINIGCSGYLKKVRIKLHFDVVTGWLKLHRWGRMWSQLKGGCGSGVQVYKRWLASESLTPGGQCGIYAIYAPCGAEMVAARKLTAGAIILEVLKRYQPGGLSEKSALLKNLQALSTAVNAIDAVEKLRTWNRNIVRAGELAVMLPDPVLQVYMLWTPWSCPCEGTAGVVPNPKVATSTWPGCQS